jgi:hypothetical protein
MGESWSNEAIISDALGRAADVEIGAADKREWRQAHGD